MYYQVQKEQIVLVDEKTFFESDDVIAVFTMEEWAEQKKLQNQYQLYQPTEHIRFCKIERHIGYLFGTFYVPVPKEHMLHKEFVLYVLEGKLVFIDNSHTIEEQIKEKMKEKLRQNFTLARFLYDIFLNLVENDLLLLEFLEQEISKIEELVLRGVLTDFNTKMMRIKKMISKLYRYYSQMTDVGMEMVDSGEEFLGKRNVTIFQIFTGRATRLQNETQTLRDYAMQVQDVYQSEIGIRQNNVMKTLTIVTTIFLPLTLIAGWYGMNFYYMPELQSKCGYPLVILASIIIVIGSLYFFKKKKYW